MLLWQRREQSVNVTAFCGGLACLADFAKVARTQVLRSHSHTEHKSDMIEQTGISENPGGVKVEVVERRIRTKISSGVD